MPVAKESATVFEAHLFETSLEVKSHKPYHAFSLLWLLSLDIIHSIPNIRDSHSKEKYSKSFHKYFKSVIFLITSLGSVHKKTFQRVPVRKMYVLALLWRMSPPPALLIIIYYYHIIFVQISSNYLRCLPCVQLAVLPGFLAVVVGPVTRLPRCHQHN